MRRTPFTRKNAPASTQSCVASNLSIASARQSNDSSTRHARRHTPRARPPTAPPSRESRAVARARARRPSARHRSIGLRPRAAPPRSPSPCFPRFRRAFHAARGTLPSRRPHQSELRDQRVATNSLAPSSAGNAARAQASAAGLRPRSRALPAARASAGGEIVEPRAASSARPRCALASACHRAASSRASTAGRTAQARGDRTHLARRAGVAGTTNTRHAPVRNARPLRGVGRASRRLRDAAARSGLCAVRPEHLPGESRDRPNRARPPSLKMAARNAAALRELCVGRRLLEVGLEYRVAHAAVCRSPPASAIPTTRLKASTASHFPVARHTAPMSGAAASARGFPARAAALIRRVPCSSARHVRSIAGRARRASRIPNRKLRSADRQIEIL